MTNPALVDALRACRLCPLHAKQAPEGVVVPPAVGFGYRPRGLMLLGEAPKYAEAEGKRSKGIPFGGESGAMLDTLLAEAELMRDEIILDYTVRHRAPNNRLRDYPEAVMSCGKWTAWMMATYDPGVVLVMGAAPLKEIYGEKAGVGMTRGTLRPLSKRHAWGARVVLASYDPGAAVYGGGPQSEVARHIVADLRTAVVVVKALRDAALR